MVLLHPLKLFVSLGWTQGYQRLEAHQKLIGFDIFSARFRFGGLPNELVESSIKLFGEKVIPAFSSRQSQHRVASPLLLPGSLSARTGPSASVVYP